MGKEINKKIRNNVLKKEELPENSAAATKIGKFYIIPCSPLMNLIHPWLYQCQEVNRQYFGYHTYWHFHLDSVNYNVYGTQGEYDWHIDANSTGTRTDMKLTCLLNLSEEAYEGGEFNLISRQGKLKFDSGEGLVVNSLIAHKVTPITKGKRITLTYWATGPLWK